MRHIVVEADGLVQIFELEDVEDRAEGLLAGDGHAALGLDQGRLHVEAGRSILLLAHATPGFYRKGSSMGSRSKFPAEATCSIVRPSTEWIKACRGRDGGSR